MGNNAVQTQKKQFDFQKMGETLLNNALYIVLLSMIAIVIIMEPSFLDIKNLTNILGMASTRIIIACGAGALIILQGTDLSAGRVVGLTAIVASSMLQGIDYASRMYGDLPALPLIIPAITGIIVGAIFGAINGFGVAKLHLHAFIVTLGSQLIAYGTSCIYIDRKPLGAQPIAGLDSRYTGFVRGNIDLGFVQIPYLLIYAAIVAVIMWFVWNKTTLGKNMFAIGGNPEAAAVSGVNITRNIMAMFIISGVLYGLAGFMEAARIGSTTSNTGINYDLDAIAGCVIGGVSFSGGIGTIPGVLVGVIILQFINYGLTFVGINSYVQLIIKGLIIILAVSIDVRKYIVKK